MSSKETGGPAFPIASFDHQVFQPKTVDEAKRLLSGMVLRDYFIAHAPTEPQHWFKPVMPPKPVARVWVSDDGLRKYDDILVALRQEGDYCKAVNRDEIENWNIDNEKQAFVQWPAAWADEMLEARK